MVWEVVTGNSTGDVAERDIERGLKSRQVDGVVLVVIDNTPTVRRLVKDRLFVVIVCNKVGV